MPRIWALSAALWLAATGAAIADPISISILTAVGIQAVAGSAIVAVTTFALTTAASLGLSFVANKLFGKKPDEAPPDVGGVQLDLRADADVPQTLLVGRTVTAGSLVYAETFGKRQEIDNSDLVQIISLADHPISSVVTQFIESQEVQLDPSGGGTPDSISGLNAENRGLLVSNGYDGLAAVQYYDGTQTAADAFTVAALGSHPERPWTSAMVGRGRAYARIHSIYEKERMTGALRWRFVVDGIKLYDPRLDTTVGGSGSHRFADLSTHAFTRNLAVICYNILRGIRVKDASGTPRHFYGIENGAADSCPLDSWFAAMNECDVTIDGEPQFWGGAEIPVSSEPLEAIRAIVKSCDGRFSEAGGVYKLRLGAPGLPVLTFTDEALRANEGDEFKPILALEQRINYVSGKFTSPDDGWTPKVAPPRTDDTMIAADGRILSADLDLPWVQSPAHVQRLQKQMLLRSRRERRHTIPLPPPAFGLEPGDIVEWSSDRNGYIDKLFEVEEPTWSPSLDVTVALTEVDHDDYDWDGEVDYVAQPVASLVQNRPAPKIIEGFDAEGFIYVGDNGLARPAIRVLWDAPEDGDLSRVEVQLRRSAILTEVANFHTEEPDAASMIILAALTPATTYQVRGRFVSFNGHATEWSLWIDVLTPDVRLGPGDIHAVVLDMNRRFEDRFSAIEDFVGRTLAEIKSQDWLGALETNKQSAGRDETLTVSLNATADEFDQTTTAISATVEDNRLVVVALEGSFASFQTTVTATFGNHQAQITSNATSVSNLSSSFASFQTSVTATFGNHQAQITSNATSVSNLSQSVATFQQSVNASIGGLSASVNTNSTAIATVNGRLAAFWGLTVDANGKIASIQLASDGTFAGMRFRADEFKFALNGFSDVGLVIGTVNGAPALGWPGNVYLDGIVFARSIAAGNITATHIGANEIVTSDANIQIARIKTLHVAGEAITAIRVGLGGDLDIGLQARNSVVNLATVVKTTQGGNVSVTGHLSFDRGTRPYDLTIYLYVNGFPQAAKTISVGVIDVDPGGAGHLAGTLQGTHFIEWSVQSIVAGQHTFQLRFSHNDIQFHAGSQAGGSSVIRSPTVRLLEGLR